MACKEVEPKIIDYLKEKLEETHIKWYANMHCVFKKPKKDDVEEFHTEDIYQASKTYTTIQPEDIDDVIPEVIQTISNKFQEFQREGSGWMLDHVEKVEIHTATYEPLMGTSYIELSPHLKKSTSIVKIQKKDNKCFLWSVLAHLHPAKKTKFRVTYYAPYEDELDASEVSFLVQISQVKIFERKNKLSINVFGLDKDYKIVPVTLSKTDYEAKINLMMISKEENNHYCLITNFSGLMRGRTKCTMTMYYCFNCLHGFSRQDLLDKHKQDCMKNQMQRLSFPEKKKDLEVMFKGKASVSLRKWMMLRNTNIMYQTVLDMLSCALHHT